jgi:adenine phosphoribosyltransferase
MEMKKPYVILRKTYKPYMGDALQAETLSITTGEPQILVLDEKDREMLKGRKVLIVDDVISTGSTLQGMRMVIEKAGAAIVKEAAILTEGERSKWEQIVSLGHLPLFTD